MNFLILTPELQSYTFVIFFTWCLGSSNLASHVYHRYFIHTTFNPLLMQCVMKGLICLAAMIVFPINKLFAASIVWQLVSVPLGLLAGWYVVKVELIINRFAQRLNAGKLLKKSMQSHYFYSRTGPGNAIMSLAPVPCLQHKTNLKKLHEHYAAHEARQQKFSLTIVLAIAIFEEIIFRGYLLQCCYLLPAALSKVALGLTVLIFGLSHASFGLRQIMAKTILGGCCMVLVLVCHTVLPALIIHSYLNWAAFRCQSSQGS